MDSPLPLSASEDPELVEGPAKKPSLLIPVLLVLLVLIILGLSGYIAYNKFFAQTTTTSNYEECLAAKDSLIQESYPQICVTSSGQRFVQPLPSPSQSSPTSFITNIMPWNTYILSTVATFKYPQDFYVNPVSESKDYVAIYNKHPEKSNGPDPEGVLYIRFKVDHNKSFSTLVNSNPKVKTADKKPVGPYIGYQLIERSEHDGLDEDNYYLETPRALVTISIGDIFKNNKLDDNYPQFKSIAEAIINSFQILNPPINISSWKTYINSQYRFSIKYPNNWVVKSPSKDKVIIDDGNPQVNEIEINLYKNSEYTSIQEYMSHTFNRNADGALTIINSQSAYEAKCCDYDKIIWINHENDGVAILKKVVIGQPDYFNLILSTLKFTN